MSTTVPVGGHYGTRPTNIVRWSALFLLLAAAIPITLTFTLSPTALVALGWQYVQTGGAGPQRIHPATYVAFLFVVALAFSKGKMLKGLMFGRDSLIYFFIGWIVLIFYAGLFLSIPFSGLVDNWVLPALLFLILCCLSIDGRRLIGRYFDFLMVANTVLGIIEFIKDWRLVPLTIWSSVLGQWVHPHEWRSTAFLGHPLTNSYVIGTYMLSLLLGLRFNSSGARFAMLGFQAIGLIVFGSRGATLMLIISIVLMILIAMLGSIKTGKLRKDIVLILGIGVPALSLIIPAVLSSGFADRFIDRIFNDRGSAETRSIAIEIVASFPVTSLFLGSPAALINAILGRYGVIAIESFWLSFLLSFGLLGCLMFFPGLFLFCRSLVRHSSRASIALLLFYFACCTTSTSLASKNLGLSFVVVICMTSLPLTMGQGQQPQRQVPVAPQVGLLARRRARSETIPKTSPP